MTKEEILEKLKFDTELRGLSKNTQDEYYTKAKIFQDHFNLPATELWRKRHQSIFALPFNRKRTLLRNCKFI